MRRLVSRAGVLVAILACVAAGCGEDDGGDGQTGGASKNGDVAAKAQEGLQSLETTVLSTGPNGEEPSPADEVELTDDELEQIKTKNATAAIVLHYGGNDWSNAQVDGLEATLGDLGIKVIAVTDANF